MNWIKNIFKSVFAYFSHAWRAIFPAPSTKSVSTPTPTPEPQKEHQIMTPELLKAKLQDRPYQLKLANWVENTLRPLEDDQKYLELCQAPNTPLTTEVLKTIFKRLYPYIVLGTPAHDLGHHFRDALGGAAILAKDLFLRSAYRNDIDAAFLGAMCHDGSTGVQHRYVDNGWELNHGELMAYIFYHITADVLSEPLRRLTAYAIAAHPHSLKDATTTNGAVRKPWNDGLFYHEGRPIRISVWVTRWTDRLENGGDPAAHLARHTLASTDGALVDGMDLHKVDWYGFKNALKYLFTPDTIVTEVVITKKDGTTEIQKIPSMLQHLKGYASSHDPARESAYNKHDGLSPSMTRLMLWKRAKSAEFINIVTTTTGTADFNVFEKLMRMVSGSPLNETGLKAIEMVRDLWNLNTPEDQAHWAGGFKMAQTSYYEWLAMLNDEIMNATDPTVKAFIPLVPEFIEAVTCF